MLNDIQKRSEDNGALLTGLTQALRDRRELIRAIIDLGRNCAVDIVGDPQEAAEVTTLEQAMAAIRECLRLGQEANNKLKHGSRSP